MSQAEKSAIQQLLQIMRQLRDPENGCPWDIQQNFASIAPYTIEEAYEVADVIERQAWQELPGELGDLLLQVVFHAQMAAEQGWFNFDDVATAINQKMINRHPHVFATGDQVDPDLDAAGQTVAWEAHKQAEREAAGMTSALDGVTAGLAELTRAVKLQKRAAQVGFDWPDHRQVLDKLDEELDELSVEIQTGSNAAMQDELGDVLFVISNLARKLNIDPAAALRHANRKFEHRFRGMEALAGQDGTTLRELNLEQQEALWQRVKGQQAKQRDGTPSKPGSNSACSN